MPNCQQTQPVISLRKRINLARAKFDKAQLDVKLAMLELDLARKNMNEKGHELADLLGQVEEKRKK